MQEPSAEIDAYSLAAELRLAGNGPLHSQLESAVRRLITTGQIPAGAELPGEHDLAAMLGLSRHTVRHALGELARDGLLSRERGRGTRVRDAAAVVTERSLIGFYAFAWEAEARGVADRSVVLQRRVSRASRDLSKRLMLGREESVMCLVRIRTAGGEPLVLEKSYFPAALVEDLDAVSLERGSLYDVIEQRRTVRITHASERIRPTVLPRTIALVLKVRPGSAAFLVERTTWAGERAIEWQQSLVRSDRFLYSVDLPRRA
jgi:GntR family transcriptional regulator